MDAKINWLQWLGIIIPASPACGYGLAYVRELGYCNFYKIPSEFIKLDWTTVLVAVAASLGALLALSWFVTMLIVSKLGNISPLKQKIAFSLLLLVFMFFIAVRYLTIEESKDFGIGFAIFLVCIFIVPWFVGNYAGITLNRPTSKDKEKEDEVAVALKRMADNKYIKYGFVIICIIGLLFVFSYLDGRSAAMDKQVFYVPSLNNQSVVLKIYGDDLICAPLNPGNSTFQQAFFVLKLNESNITLTAVKFINYLRASDNIITR